MDVEFDDKEATEQLRRLAKTLSKRELAKLGARAMNRARTAGRATMSREIRKDFVMKASDAKDQIQVTKATPAKLSVELTVNYDPIPVMKFSGKERKKGISYRAKKSSGRKMIKGAFVVPRWDNAAFIRVDSARFPLKMLYGPSIGSQADRAWPATQARMIEIMNKRMEHEIGRAVEKANK